MHKVCECNTVELKMNSHGEYYSGIKIKQTDYILWQLEGWEATQRDGGGILELLLQYLRFLYSCMYSCM